MHRLLFRLTLIVFLAALPMAGLIVYNAFEQRSWITLHNQRELLRLVQHGAADYHQAIQQTRQLLGTLSNYPAINQRDAAASSDLLSKVLQEDSIYANIFATSPDGAIFASALPTRGPNNVSNRTYFQHVIQSRRFALGELVIGHTIGKPTLHCAYPVLNLSGQIKAVVVAALDLSKLFSALPVAELPVGHSITIIDDQGKILFRYPDPEAWVGKIVSEAENIKLVMTQKQGVGTANSLDGQEKLYAFIPLEGIPTPGFIYAGIPTKTLYAPVNQSLYQNLLMLGAAAAITLLLTWLFGHFFVTRRLAILTNTTRRLSAGNLSARTGLSSGTSEIDQLASSFDQMAESLQRQEAERLQAEESIRRLFRQNQLILDTTVEGIVGLDLNGRISFINPAAATMTGYEVAELIGQDLHQYIHHTKPDGTSYYLSECPMNITLIEGKASTVSDEVLWRKNGSSFPAAYSATPIMEEGNIVGTVVVFRDISERKKAEIERAKLESQLHQAQKLEAIGTLAGGIAHDFNNILMAILGYTELASTGLPEDSRAYNQLAEVLKAGNRARDLVQQILAFSRQSEGEQKPVQIGALIQEALKMLHSTLPTTIDIRQNIVSDGMVMADPIQLHQIIINLCTNAYHAMRDNGGILEVSLTSVMLDSSMQELIPGLYVQLSVSDTGKGIDPAIQDRIFDPFFTTKGPGEGTGLGLSVVHGIVQKYGGSINFYSEPGKGAIFHIFLPQLVTDDTVSTAEEDDSKLPRGTEHILVIDDEEVLTKLTSEMLTSLGYEITTCTSSIGALEILQTYPNNFDLVLTDQTMPQMTGIQLAQELRRLRQNIPIILCTGYSDKVSEETIKIAGINELLIKPINLRNLAKTVHYLLLKEEK